MRSRKLEPGCRCSGSSLRTDSGGVWTCVGSEDPLGRDPTGAVQHAGRGIQNFSRCRGDTSCNLKSGGHGGGLRLGLHGVAGHWSKIKTPRSHLRLTPGMGEGAGRGPNGRGRIMPSWGVHPAGC